MGTQPGRGCACVVGFELITVRIPRTFFVRVLRVFCFLRVLVSCPPPPGVTLLFSADIGGILQSTGAWWKKVSRSYRVRIFLLGIVANERTLLLQVDW